MEFEHGKNTIRMGNSGDDADAWGPNRCEAWSSGDDALRSDRSHDFDFFWLRSHPLATSLNRTGEGDHRIWIFADVML